VRLPRLRTAAATWIAVVAGALCIALAVAVALLAGRVHSDSAEQTTRRQAVHAARTITTRLLSYDYRHIRSDIAAARASTAGRFRREYVLSTTRLQSEARRLRAIVQAEVKAVSVMSAGRSQVVLLIFVDQTSVKQVPGQARPVSRLDQNRVQMTLSRIGGHWLVTELASL
jgi:hypothetical protein